MEGVPGRDRAVTGAHKRLCGTTGTASRRARPFTIKNNEFSGPRAVAGVAAITLAVPLVAYLYSVLRTAERTDRWLAPAALATGIAGIVLKLSNGVPELAAHQAHLAPDTQLGAAVHTMGDGATLLSLYPLAVFCAATAASRPRRPSGRQRMSRAGPPAQPPC
jgi:hypothetical protein